MSYSTDSIIKDFEQLDDMQKVEILHSALEYMRKYNGRITYDFICFAMGYEPDSQNDDKWHFVNVPTFTDDKSKEIAIKLHRYTCKCNHTDGCSWFYEIKDGMHDWSGFEHKRYLNKVKSNVELAEKYVNTLIEWKEHEK